ncbi:hypothetical protein [Paenibacillus xylanexedens]|uniref:hypothetical protein n=1 Tax=Paenibacillus xylanexedens TaxID=528191 RepID=UPI0011A48266|nr:hypothetical protein [Paenibacillus xylanexedens]
MPDKESEKVSNLNDYLGQDSNSINLSIGEIGKAMSRYNQNNSFIIADTISRLNEINQNINLLGERLVKLLDSAGVFQTVELVNNHMETMRKPLLAIAEKYDISAYQRLGEALYEYLKPVLESEIEVPEFTIFIEDTLDNPIEEENNIVKPNLLNEYVGYILTYLGFNPKAHKNKVGLYIIAALIILWQLLKPIYEEAVVKSAFPDKEEKTIIYPSSNYTKEQIDRYLDLEERKIIFLENEQKKDSK